MFGQEMFGSAPTFDVDVVTFGTKWRQNLMSWRHNDVLYEGRNTPHVRRHFLAPVGFTEIPVGYARNLILNSV